MSSVGATFDAALRSVGTACTMASAGFYLHRRGFVTGDGKRTLALLSQQVTIPAFLFTKILFCRQDGSGTPCPNITDSLSSTWMLLLWPAFVVGCGLCVGKVAAIVSKTPKRQTRSVLAACAFGNSTGLPITLLTVIHTNFPVTSELGLIDPTLFLSVYLLLYPVLQWGIGGWLLAPEAEDDSPPYPKASLNHVLNFQCADDADEREEAATRLIRELSFMSLADIEKGCRRQDSDTDSEASNATETSRLLSLQPIPENDPMPLTFTLTRIAGRVFQPPVIGALLGLSIASNPRLRGVFVDIFDRDGDAVLEWLFDGLYAIGLAAVPVNMVILGINLSITANAKADNKGLLSNKTTFAVIIGKMVVMPAIGILSTFLLKSYVLDIPDDIDTAFYLVMMIVFITPTANNVMVMVELSGSGTKEGIARLIGWQYLVAPALLSVTVAVVVAFSNLWG